MLLLAYKFKNSTWVKTQRSLQCPVIKSLNCPCFGTEGIFLLILSKPKSETLKICQLKGSSTVLGATRQQQLLCQTQMFQGKAGNRNRLCPVWPGQLELHPAWSAQWNQSLRAWSGGVEFVSSSQILGTNQTSLSYPKLKKVKLSPCWNIWNFAWVGSGFQ